MNRFSRVLELFGESDFEIIKNAKVLIVGVGGVGGVCLDCLYRSGVQDITIVDFDKFDITNQNRQIGSQEVGALKTEVLKKYYQGIKSIDIKITPKWVDEFDFDSFDIVIDAIDDIASKAAMIKKAHKLLVSSGASAKKTDPTKISYINLWDSRDDPLLKRLKQILKKQNFNKNFKVVSSSEPIRTKNSGSFMAVTGAFGLTLCSLGIEKILKKGL